MKIELIFEDRIFTHHPEFLPNGYTEEEMESEKPDFLTVNHINHLPSIGDHYVWNTEEKPQRATEKQWEILKRYSFVVVSRTIAMNDYVSLSLDII